MLFGVLETMDARHLALPVDNDSTRSPNAHLYFSMVNRAAGA